MDYDLDPDFESNLIAEICMDLLSEVCLRPKPNPLNWRNDLD